MINDDAQFAKQPEKFQLHPIKWLLKPLLSPRTTAHPLFSSHTTADQLPCPHTKTHSTSSSLHTTAHPSLLLSTYGRPKDFPLHIIRYVHRLPSPHYTVRPKTSLSTLYGTSNDFPLHIIRDVHRLPSPHYTVRPKTSLSTLYGTSKDFPLHILRPIEAPPILLLRRNQIILSPRLAVLWSSLLLLG